MTDNSAKARLMLGNEAIAWGALEAGASFISCYPGTPSSEVVGSMLGFVRDCPESNRPVIEYSINEKVAMEGACGSAISGSPALVAMKHVGLNVASDPLFTAAYLGTPGGLVVLSADDPGCHSSQNEQDNRYYARAAHLPCFEPASVDEARRMTIEAFRLGRQLEQPILLRTTTRINHSRGATLPGPMIQPRPGTNRPQSQRFVPVPAVAKVRHHAMLAQMTKAKDESEKSPFNNLRLPEQRQGKIPGIITSGMARAYLADALMELEIPEEIAVLELGMTWPLPEKMISDFLAACHSVLVLEEGEALLEKDIKALNKDHSVSITGKDHFCLTELGEYSLAKVKKSLLAWLADDAPSLHTANTQNATSLPSRPPNLCPGCAHRSVYYAARRLFGDSVVYSSDIGCYTLGLLPPLRTADFALCMGSSISAGAGFAAASGKPVIAFIGDSTFFHSGLTGVANAVFNKRDLLLVILDNGTTAMTGHQPNPGMHQLALGSQAAHLDIDAILAGLGVNQRKTVRAHNLTAVTQAFNELAPMKGVRVLLAREPCLLFARSTLKKEKRATAEVVRQCDAGEKCLRELACPAFTRTEGKLAINPDLCGGCMLCVQIAPEAFQPRKASYNAKLPKSSN